MPNDSPSLIVDDSLWPLLIVQIRGTVPLARFEEYLEQRLTYLQRPERHVTLFDMRHASLLDTQMLGHALVITSPVLRLMLSTFLRVRPRSAPYTVTTHLNDAARWCLTLLEEAGSHPPTERIKAHFEL